jgi:hypothetical protein
MITETHKPEGGCVVQYRMLCELISSQKLIKHSESAQSDQADQVQEDCSRAGIDQSTSIDTN